MQVLNIIQIVSAIALVVAILMQNRGGGLGGLFGGGDNVYLAKRGIEKKLYYATIILSIIFFVTSLLSVII